MISTDINIVLPEITLAVFSMAALMVAVYGGKDKLAGLMIWVTSGVMCALGLWQHVCIGAMVTAMHVVGVVTGARAW